MTMTFVIALNAVLDLGIVLALAAVIGVPFRLGRRRTAAPAQLHAHQRPAKLFDVDLAA